ncbi:Oligopeptide transporter [Schizosaccharomyces pombe]
MKTPKFITYVTRGFKGLESKSVENNKDHIVENSSPIASKFHEFDEQKKSFEIINYAGHEKFVDDITERESSVPENAVYDITVRDIDAIVPVTDDVDIPASTFRMWILAFGLATVIAGVDAFFLMRYPSVSIAAIVALLVAYPLGQLWYYIIPQWEIKLPRGIRVSLNPGRFNRKEHACLYIFVNICVSAKLVNTLIIEQIKFFGVNIGIGRAILFNLCSYLSSFGWSGLALPILVYPPTLIWPSVLSSCALFKTFHDNDNTKACNWTISRLRYFFIVFVASFIWYWFPDLIFPALSSLGAWISWCKPSSAVLSQIFGVKTGLGLFPLTLDWAQISSLSNPLITPWWATCCIFTSFVFWIWIVLPGLYYQNHWQVAHFPIMTNSIYTVSGESYDAQKVVDSKWELVTQKYQEYSPVMLPIAFIINIALSLGAFSSMMISFFLRFPTDVIQPICHVFKYSDIHTKLLKKYKRVHWGFYLASIIVSLGLGFAFTEGWHDIQIRSYGFVVSMVIGAALYIPLSLIESRSSFTISMQAFFEIVAAFWFNGQPMALLYFYSFGFGTLQHAMHMTQSAKIGHYMKVPPRLVAALLFTSGIWSSLVNSAVTGWIMYHVRDVCTSNAENNMTCRSPKTQFNSHLIWGLVGNHIFSSDGRYSFVMWFFLVGAIVSVVVYLLQISFPKSSWKHVNPALLLGGAAQIPSVTGINYSTWAAVAFCFNYLIRRGYYSWWKKYNLITAAAMDCGVAIAGLFIYFCVVYTGGSSNFSWWGTTVSSAGCDKKGCAHLSVSDISKPSGW